MRPHIRTPALFPSSDFQHILLGIGALDISTHRYILEEETPFKIKRPSLMYVFGDEALLSRRALSSREAVSEYRLRIQSGWPEQDVRPACRLLPR